MPARIRSSLVAALALGAFALAGIAIPILASESEEKGSRADFTMIAGYEPTLDPSLMTDMVSQQVGLGLFEGLTQYDPQTCHAVPALAESWSTSPDGLTVTFKLRKAKWSDGKSVTAGDFVYAMERILDPETAAEYAYLPCMVIKGASEFNAGTGSFADVGIRAVDSRTLEYRLTGPAPYFADMTAHSSFWPVPRWAVEEHGSDWTQAGNIVTNGPYVLAENVQYGHLLLEKSRRYWDSAQVSLASIRILTGDDSAANYRLYKDGRADWLYGIYAAKLDEIKRRTDYQTSPQLGTYYYLFNITRAPVDNVLVRKALAAAIDKRALVDKVTRGGQIPTDSWVPPMEGYVPQKGQGFDPVAARRFLAEAGYPDGKGFPVLTIAYNTNEGHKAIAEYIKQQWKANLNIEVTLKNMEFKTFIDLRSRQHDFTVCRHGWIGDYLDPNTMLDLFVSGGGNNDGLYSNPEYDKLIEAAKTASGAERMAILQKAEALYMADQPMIPIYFYANQDLIDTAKWGGWHSNILGLHPWKGIYRLTPSTTPKT